MTHLNGGTGANGQVTQILKNQSCIRESILPRTSGECGGSSKHTLQCGKSGLQRHNEETSITAAESKGLKKGNRVYWRGDATDGGSITETSWDAVTIAWDNGQVATVHHGDMREIQRAPAKPIIV